MNVLVLGTSLFGVIPGAKIGGGSIPPIATTLDSKSNVFVGFYLLKKSLKSLSFFFFLFLCFLASASY